MTQFYVHNHIIDVHNVLTSEHKPALRTFDNLGTFRIFSLYQVIGAFKTGDCK